MKKVLSATVIFCSVVLGIQAQTTARTQANIRIMKDKPSVYITFERVGQLKAPDPGDEKERVWLRLHNNTRWPIMLDMSAVPSGEYGDAGLFYEEVLKGEVTFRMQCHVCTLNSLGPGKSLLFSIPQAGLAKERAIRVRFSYSWEDQNDVAGGRETEHYVYFHAEKLPQSVQERIE
ncbi:MAG TPA: hypothetical protein VJT69_17425 [Pyrinomonadaceae bacterium]|nr:hypothetical protein [Pyrinomonadaceae bacterium]